MRLVRATVDRFLKKISDKQMYCFGAGSELYRFFDEFRDCHMEDRIKNVVDNCPEKCGTVEINGTAVSVIHTDRMLLEIKQGDVILITTAYFIEVAGQLRQYGQLENTEVFISAQIWEEQCDRDREKVFIPSKLYTKSEPDIPKKIHYCWFGGRAIPEQSRIWMESWKRFCPDYEIIEWNESNYDVTKNLYIKQAYERQKWAFVSDYARLDVIEQYGGVYLDTDVELLRNIDDLLKNDAFCGFEQKRYVAFGLGYGAVRHHAVVKKLREDYEERCFVLEDGSLNEKTCVKYQTEFLLERGLKLNGQYQVLDGITVYPELVLCGMSPYSFRISQNLEHTYAIHHYAASWHGQEFHAAKERKRRFFDEMELE